MLHFKGLVHGKLVLVLLNGGSTHNFVQTQIAKFLNLSVEAIPNFSVMVGNGDCLSNTSIVRHVSMVIQDQTILVTFYVFTLKDWDMALSVSWLVTLGPILTKYTTSQFEFQHEESQKECNSSTTQPPKTNCRKPPECCRCSRQYYRVRWCKWDTLMTPRVGSTAADLIWVSDDLTGLV
ncbi:hypothetical protein J1N35_000567 [Gossypium stocksii]|uniref:Uncharacterized protein n=1 Tax=Gossypium stocksii TaxID=47602 RepID=A0A9D3WH31_9ROSI|nr:hypothetical protein J1N35_000567 [Gossypium stocksii]